MKQCLVIDLGLMEYGAAWALQQRLVAARKIGFVSDLLLLCEHPHVITLGRNGKIANLRASDRVLGQMGVSFFETDRGGDITYHGPGQLVGYPILNLGEIRRDVAWYVRGLEEGMLRATSEFGIASRRVLGRTGVWVDVRRDTEDVKEVEELKEAEDEEKLGAIGVHLSRWVTSHGFAYNVATDLRYFDLIVPCGIVGKRATSLERLLRRRVEIAEVAPRVIAHLGEIFGLEMRAASCGELDEMLQASDERTAPAAV